jgi:hypothetical protein
MSKPKLRSAAVYGKQAAFRSKFRCRRWTKHRSARRRKRHDRNARIALMRATDPSVSGRSVFVTGGALGFAAELVLALFLAADDSKMITGQQFIIDAGRV